MSPISSAPVPAVYQPDLQCPAFGYGDRIDMPVDCHQLLQHFDVDEYDDPQDMFLAKGINGVSLTKSEWRMLDEDFHRVVIKPLKLDIAFKKLKQRAVKQRHRRKGEVPDAYAKGIAKL